MTEHRYRDVNEALPTLMLHVMAGQEVGSRAGTVRELLYPHIVLTEPWRRDVTVPGRRVSAVAQIAETMWILAGRNDVEWLSHYLPRAGDFSDDGIFWRGGYGPRLRDWEGVDQLAYVVDLLRTDPESRRAVITLYDPVVDSAPGKDIPCNNWLHFLTRDGRLDLHVVIRSNDLMWGWSGINAYEWSALQEIVAGLTGDVEVGELHFSVSSLHLYEQHWDRARQIAAAKGSSTSPPTESPRFKVSPVWSFQELIELWFDTESRLRDLPERRDNLTSVRNFPEPMMRGWLAIVGWWWSKDRRFLEPYEGTPLVESALLSPGAPKPSFLEYVVQLHAEKHAVYGDSWKRRGEAGILGNIARKIDRLGVAGAGDTAADTVVDLLVYLVKYRLWLTGGDTDSAEPVAEALRDLDGAAAVAPEAALVSLQAWFEALTRRPSVQTVDAMLLVAYALADQLWTGEQK